MNPAPSVSQSVSLSVRPSVRDKKFSYFPSLLFSETLHDLDHYKCRKVTKPVFPGKLNLFGPALGSYVSRPVCLSVSLFLTKVLILPVITYI